MINVDALLEELSERSGPDGLDRVEDCLRLLTGERQPEYPDPEQEPTRLFFPGLEARPWFEAGDFSWCNDVEAAADSIRWEMLALADDGRSFRPYEDPHTKELGWAGWTTSSIYRAGELNEAVAGRCPRTLAVLDGHHGPREGMFATMRPGTHITPHTGGANVVLTCHLGLLIPDRCGIRVRNETRTWSEGRCLVFDDSYMHEAWNRSGSSRSVLIWDVWHPDLTSKERDCLELLLPRLWPFILGG